MTSLLAATLGASRRVSWALPCTSARRSRLLPEVFFLTTVLVMVVSSPRVRAISRELDETRDRVQKWITPSCARILFQQHLPLFQQHCIVSKPPGGSESGEAALRRLLVAWLAPDSLTCLVPAKLPMELSWAMFFLSGRHEPLNSHWKC